MGRSSVRPVVRGFIAEQHVRSLFTATSQICSGTRSEEHNCLIMPDTPLPDPDVVRRFVPRTVVHWLCLLMILFMRHSDRGDIDKHHHLRANSYTE